MPLNLTEVPDQTPGKRLRKAFRLKEILYLSLVNLLVVILIGTFSLQSPAPLVMLANQAVFAYAIGFMLYFFLHLSGAYLIRRPVWRSVAVVLVMAAGGVAGTGVAAVICKALFGFVIPSRYFGKMLIQNAVLAALIGAVASSYRLLQERLKRTAARLAEKEISEQRLQRLRARAELEALRARVNPHFLFNTLNSIVSLIAEDPGRAEQMVQKLAQVFRYVLEAGDRDRVPLADELRTVEAYLDIEQVRLQDRLTVVIEVETEIREALVPPLILQPLVENAVKHGLAPLRRGGIVSVRCRRKEETLCLQVEDTGVGIPPVSSRKEGFGLRGIRERLELCYGDDFSFAVDSDQGTRVTLTLPGLATGTGFESKPVVKA